MTNEVSVRKKQWLKFQNDNIIEESVNPIVVDSWKRCKKLRLDQYGGEGQKLDDEEFKDILNNNKELLKIARPIMRKLHSLVLESHYALVLTDKNGYIIESMGDMVFNDEANKLRFEMGSLWSEEAVGTNGIGTTLIVDKPLHITGEEHYCISHHPWTCSGTTIHNVNGEIIGCLNMSGDVSQSNSHTLGIVVAAAYTIENQIALQRSYEIIEKTFESTFDGIVIIDKDYKINKINKRALEILALKNNENEIQKIDVLEVFKDIDLDMHNNIFNKGETEHYTDFTLYIGNKRISCNGNVSPMLISTEITGLAIAFKESKYIHKVANKVTNNIARYTFDNIITGSEVMKKVINSGKRMAQYKSSVLIEGESGTGKELFAQSIHNYSKYSEGPFVAVNCASLPRDLIESELFGYEKGAFTGALKDGNPGKFELADGGTIFLDEIGEMPLEVQAKLLRVLDSLTVRRIGGKYEKKLNVRILAATNRNLYEEVQKKNFREDLYYRLNVFKLEIPPLRERRGDIRLCAEYFLKKLNYEHKGRAKKFSEKFLECLEKRKWTGNVRELQNYIERAYYLSETYTITLLEQDKTITKTRFEKRKNQDNQINNEVDSFKSVDSVMKNNIEFMLEQCNGNVIEAGKKLNMSKSSIYRKIKKYDIVINNFKRSRI